MSRKFSWYRSRYYSSEGLEVVPAEGIEVGFPKELKPLPEPPEKRERFYDKALRNLLESTDAVVLRVREMDGGKERRGESREIEGMEGSGLKRTWSWRKRILGVQIVWLVVGLVIFGFGLGIGGWIASMVVAGNRGGVVIVPDSNTPSLAASSLVASAVETSTSFPGTVPSTEATSRLFITSTRSASLAVTATSRVTSSAGRAAALTRTIVPVTVDASAR